MALLFMEAVGPNAEQLALDAGAAADVPVGYDSDLGSATFDSDAYDDAGLRDVVTEALASLDPDWQTHLRVTE
jgi:hypothetical protein